LRTRIVLILLLATVVAGCGAASSAGHAPVVASFYPLAFAAEQVSPRGTHVDNLTPPGAEPHDLEVSPSDVGKIDAAQHVLLMGHGFQPQLEDAAGSGDRVVRALDTPGLQRLPNGDPHVWLDPTRYALIVRRIGSVLHRPAAARRLVRRLDALDRQYRRGLKRCERRDLVTSHEAFAYLAQHYGLSQTSVTGLTPESEPTPRALEHVVDQVRASGATTVFLEPLVSSRIADTVAHETGTRTAVLDPLEGQPKHGDYFAVMRANLAELRKALGCR
jgi:zinc transport system substrate-binding protein